MFIAHLPAGYIAAQLTRHKWVFWGVMAGSILPDLDMLWFYLVDGAQIHHHSYLTHRPALWAFVLIVGLTLRKRAFGFFLTGVGFGGLLHMMLDSIVGAIAWGWPLTDANAPLVVVPATRDWWVMSFLTHWTFLVEIVICAVAFTLWLRQRA